MPKTNDAKFYLELSKKHLERVQQAWEEPDWADLSMYGLYCLEAAVRAASLHASIYPKQASHAKKQDLSSQLRKQFKFPDIADLMSKWASEN